MKRQLLALTIVLLCMSVQAQFLRKSFNPNSPSKMGVQIKKVAVNSLPVQMNKSKTLVTAKSQAASNGPGVSYTLPQGTLFQGMSNDYYGYSNTFAYASPYSNWDFINLTATSPSFLWTESKYQGTDSTATSLDFNLKVKADSYNMPSLKGSANGVDSTFIFGTSYDSFGAASYIDAGGAVYVDAETSRSFNWTNWINDLSQVTWTFAPNVYSFGTGPNKIDALVSLYDKPQTTLYFEGANFFLGAFNAPANTSFTLRVITVNIDARGKITPKDTLATSHATTEDVIVSAATAQVMPFTKLVSIDKDGFETSVPYLELNDPFILELSGFNVTGVTLGARSSYYDSEGTLTLPYTKNHTFLYAPDSLGVRSLLAYSWPATLLTSLTNAAYTYLLTNTKSVIADVIGGNTTVTLTPLFDSVWVAGTVPSWIAIEQTEHYVSPNWGTDAKLTYQPLPVGVTGRSADIEFKTWGAQVTVHVSQGEVAGISSVKETKSKVYNSGNAFELTYPSEFNKVSLINLSGQVIRNYDLPILGKFSIPTGNVSKGLYLLKFDGKGTETIKVNR